jgi:hypothetical protein
MRPLRLLLLATLAVVTAASAANADTWTAARLRGIVLQFVDGAWQPVHRNDAVPDETVIRTMASGHVDFTRGAETVSVGPTTQIQIFDKGGVKPFTTVNEAFGTVTIDAEVENVQHFAVETPYLAAVVKGTKFTVTSGKDGSSVEVLRGHVEVDDKANKTHTLISVGQSAAVGDGTTSSSNMSISGKGVLPPVLDAAGNVVGGVKGLAKGLVNGVGNGLKGLTGLGGDSGNGKDQGSGNDGNGGGNNGVGGIVGGVVGGVGGIVGGVGDGVGGLLGGLHLKLGYSLEPVAPAADPGLWI